MKASPLEQDDWLDRHRPYLVLLARTHLNQRLAPRVDASDVVQQTLMDAYAHRHQYRGTTDVEFLGWLQRILRNNLLDAIRHQEQAKRDIRLENSLEAIQQSFSRVDQWLEAIQTSPSQHVRRQEELLRLSTALTQLPEAQREAIILHHLQGLKLTEVAAQIGRTESAVAGLLFRGMSSLHQWLS
jgi:RNA polymerase sigma-70 factor, ECF subfamily